jgi:hypothetical protein
MTSLFCLFGLAHFHFLGPKARQAVLCCAVLSDGQREAVSLLFWLILGMMIGRRFYFL